MKPLFLKEDVFMNYDKFFMNSSEWLEQKAKVVSLEQKIKNCSMLICNLGYGEPDRLHFIRVRSGLRLAHDKAYRRLLEIENDLIEKYDIYEYNLDAYSHVFDYCEEDYYERQIEHVGFIRGFKF